MVRIIAIAAAYIVGSWSPGAMIALMKGIDITRLGSGSSGATNTARVIGKKYFMIVFLIDLLKAFLYLSFLIWTHCSIFILIGAAVGLIIGNTYSWWLNFKGGKGVATSTGILLALDPVCVPLLFTVWSLFFAMTRTVGLASVGTFCALIVYGLLIIPISGQIGFLMILLALLGLWKHRDNIARAFWIIN